MSLVGWLNRRVVPWITALGSTPRSVTLEVRGRRSGRPVRVALSPATLADQRYLVSLAGERDWVKNVQKRTFTRSPHQAAVLYVGVERPVLQDLDKLASKYPVFPIEQRARQHA